MAISGTPYSVSSTVYQPPTDTLKFRQGENAQKQSTFNDNEFARKEPVEFILRGELLEDVAPNNSFREKPSQTIDPANQSAISNYENYSKPNNESLALQQQGTILDAYA